jgi:hypothetical protein
MTLLNVVCFGPEDPYIHEHILDARCDGLFKDPDRFRLDEWLDWPRPGMLAHPALITYVPAHAGQVVDDGTSFLSVDEAWAPFGDFGTIGGKAVVLDACDTASDPWLYDRGKLRSQCWSLKNKPLLGGSRIKKPQKSHGVHILSALVDVLSGIDNTTVTDDELLPLLEMVLDLAVTKAVSYSTLRLAYRVRIVTPTI